MNVDKKAKSKANADVLIRHFISMEKKGILRKILEGKELTDEDFLPLKPENKIEES
jgi:hypothetical protein